jgi:hypothetical protein
LFFATTKMEKKRTLLSFFLSIRFLPNSFILSSEKSIISNAGKY